MPPSAKPRPPSAKPRPPTAKPSSDDSSPLDRVLDLALYGPIGLAIAAREVLPQWVDAGRRQVDAQLTLARTLGRLAVHQGSRPGNDVLRRVTEQAETVLVGLGLVGRDGTGVPDHPAADGDRVTESSVAESPATESRATRPLVAEPPAAHPGPDPTVLATEPPAAATDAAQLAIPGYDTLSASQVVQRLPGLSPDELEAVRLHEVAGRSRKTVLLKVAQLRQGP